MSLDNFTLECEKDNKELEDTIKVLKNKIQRLEKENERLSKDVDMWMTYYNEEFEKNRELQNQLEVGEQQYNDLVEEKEKLENENQALKDNKNIALTYMKNYLQMELRYQNKEVAEHFKIVIYTLNRGNKHGNLVDIIDYETQQKEFIRYMDNIIKNLETEDVDDEELKGYLIQRIDTLKEILNKYKEIVNGTERN